MLDRLLTGEAAWFGVPAIVGSGLFIIRMIMMLFGHHHGIDLHHDAPDTAGHDGEEPGTAFKILSFQAFMSFTMGFGWGGILALFTFHLTTLQAGVAGVVSGLFMVWLLAVMLKAVFDLQTSGNVPLDAALGCEGDVYVNIPPSGQGTGQVRLVVSERQRIYNAHSDGGAMLSQSRVRVVRVNPDNTLTVTPA